MRGSTTPPKMGEDTVDPCKQAQPTTQTLNLPQLFMLSTFSCSDSSRLISHIWLEHEQTYTRLHHQLLEKHEPKNAHFEAKTQKRRTTGRGTHPQRQNLCTPIPSTHPPYPLSNTFCLIFSPFLTTYRFSHTMAGPKDTTPLLPSKRDRQVTRNEGRKFFSLQKRVKPNICLDLLVRRWKRDTTSWFKN